VIKESLLVLPASSFGARRVRVGKDGGLARWGLGAGHKLEQRKLQLKMRKNFFPLRGAGALAQAAQGGCGVSFSGDIPAPPGRGAVQPALGDPAWAGGWAGGSPKVPFNPHHPGILWVCGTASRSCPAGSVALLARSRGTPTPPRAVGCSSLSLPSSQQRAVPTLCFPRSQGFPPVKAHPVLLVRRS